MATTAPFVNLLRQLARAKDDYRTGALDITWDGGKASLFLVFGQPTHAVMETSDGSHLEGSEALTALVAGLPNRFAVSSWRKVVARSETLKCTLEELMEPFAQMAGAASPSAPGATGAPGGVAGLGGEADVDFGLEDFPLLPLGPSLWADAAASVVHLDVLIPTLPDALIVLTAPKLRAAAVVVDHRLVDAVWVDDVERITGEAAAMALMGAADGSVSGYCLDSPELALALTKLWRCPVTFSGLPAPWVDADRVLADIERGRRGCALVVTGDHRAVALLSAGRLIGVYTDSDRQPSADRERLARALAVPGATLTLRAEPETRSVERLPEASFHAFVAPALPATPPEPAPTAAVSPMASAAPVPPAPQGPGRRTPAPAAAAPSPPQPPPSPSGTASQAAPFERPAGTPPPRGARPAPEAAAPPPDPAPGGTLEPLLSVSATTDRVPDPATAASMFTDAAPDWNATVPAADGAAQEMFVGLPSGQGPDYEAVKADLIQIGALWLGRDDLAPVAEMISSTKPSIGAFLATIDAIKALSVPGHEASVIRAMAREMHYHAAEYLSGV